MSTTTINWLDHPSLVLPAYTYADAARLTSVPAQTIRNWFKGVYGAGHSMEPVMSHSGHVGLSYLQLAEVAFVEAMRRKYGRAGGVKLSVIRTAYDYVRNSLGVAYPFIQERFFSQGVDLLIEVAGNSEILASASRPGQIAWREAVEAYGNQFDYDQHLSLIWYPRGRVRNVIVDPRISFGRPTIKGTGIPTESVAAQLGAGDKAEDIARDFNITPQQVEDARWFEENIRFVA